MLKESFKLAAIGTCGAMSQAISGTSGVDRLLLRAVVLQYEGDVDGAARLLRRALAEASDADRAAIADMLAPICVMRHQNSQVSQLADILEEHGWLASAHAFRSLAAADTAKRDIAFKHLAASEHALEEQSDEIMRFRVLQRLSRSAFYLNDYSKSFDYAIASAALCMKLEAWRSAAACYSVAYVIQHHVYQNESESKRYAELWQSTAQKAGDKSFAHAALAAEYESAVQYGNTALSNTLDDEIKRRLLPEQYAERFQLVFANAIVQGASNLVAMKTMLQVVRELPNLTDAKRSICTALIALSEAAAYDDASARRDLREAVSSLGRPRLREPAYESEYRRLSRIAVAATCALLEDDVRSQRILNVRELAGEDSSTHLLSMMRSGDWSDALPRMRGIARVFTRAYKKRHSIVPPAGLTVSEFDILKLLAEGWQATRIASETGRSVHTVYSHTRSILNKLDAKRAPEAVAIARKRGYLN